MINHQRCWRLICWLTLVFCLPKVYAQPTLPDITGSNENGIVIISWVCQFDGVKSISVRRSNDSLFNFSTIGYVRNVLKGTQAYADGHPYPGKNFYKLSVVFNSGLTWSSNFYGVYVDSESIQTRRILPSNEALQKLLITDNPERASSPTRTASTAKTEPPKKPIIAPGDVSKYMEVIPIKRDSPITPRIKLAKTPDDPSEAYLEGLPAEARKKIKIAYEDEPDNPAEYVENVVTPTPKKKISITFEDKDDANAFIEAMPKKENRKLTLTFQDTGVVDNGVIDTKRPTPKKIALTFNDETEARNYIENIPATNRKKITLSYNADTTNAAGVITQVPEKKTPPKPKISLKFPDDNASATSMEIKSKYVNSDPITGHIQLTMPADLAQHHYSLKFYDKDNHSIIDVPKINAPNIILDKRNFQKKGQYKFTLRRDAIEFETGFINIF